MKKSTVITSFLLLTLLTFASCSNSSNDGTATATQEGRIANSNELQGHWSVLFWDDLEVKSDSELNEKISEIEKGIDKQQEGNPLYSAYNDTIYLSENKIISFYGSSNGEYLNVDIDAYEMNGKNSFTTQYYEETDEPLIISHEIIRFDGKRLIIKSYPLNTPENEERDIMVGIYERVTEEKAKKVLNTDKDLTQIIDRLNQD